MIDTTNFTVTVLPSQARRNHKSVWGVKATANKKGIKKAPLAQMNEDSTGLIR